ncbi:D-alanyl-D-alanine carboxypeptidase/D-alanyl-D-alanine-endopeptidase [Protofrankia sp. BMG5.30]|uniref:D-alanyl-D-alanine carboxypeptidase/D-alanyl-D-alanine endopeptidase n=1 Tax=Protofrankia sp. BMG5.30 TaxID=1834514 RepID=UPI0009770C3C|nr:D-alanyl-D-alanine carboxypeptidase/D-alanyl-D-alanine-endopeptidase [Protofrankia sp. BMG5.30]ONH38143.1 D-alanyl-D-alanine carboxypeptidase/D-alanyl-D-alanine-endopeptidase [Protofrankia sp. BMG5.30]
MPGRVGGLTAIATALLAGHLSVPPVDSPSIAPAPRPAAAPFPALDPTVRVADPAAVSARLARPLANLALGNPAGLVVDALSGATLFDRGSTTAVAPASTLKTVVAAAALTTFDARTTLTTRVFHTLSTAPAGPEPGDPVTGTVAAAGTDGAGTTGRPSSAASAGGGTLWLVGAGDPTLTAATGPADYPAPARLSELAAQVRAAGITEVDRLVGDGTLFTGPSTAAGWRDSYVAEGNVTPVSALEVDGGRTAPGAAGPRTTTPDLAAVNAFAAALRRAGVRVASTGVGAMPGGPEAGSTGGPGSGGAGPRQVAEVRSPPIPLLVERMLTYSDNDLAESLGRLVAHARGLPASFDGATRAVLDVLRELAVPTAGANLADTSGLSTSNQITPATLVALLRTAVLPGHPQLRTLLTGLPVAGFSGTLGDRYHAPDTRAGAGDVRAKTGSLRIVTSLAGQVVDTDGRLLLFGFFAPVEEAGTTRAALDQVAVALASCGC